MNASNFKSEKITLAAGAVSKMISVVGTAILVSPTSANDVFFIEIKIDNSGFRRIQTGSKIELKGDEQYTSFQFKNPNAQEREFFFLAINGNIESYNMSLNGDLSVKEAGGTLVGRSQVDATEAGVSVAVSKDAKEVLFYVEDYPVEIYDGAGNKILRLEITDIFPLPVTNQTLTLKGVGGTSKICLTEKQ